jgi:GntR family transcriptional regulator
MPVVKTGKASRIRIDKSSTTPAYLQIAERTAEAVGEGSLSPGARLPSERRWAEKLGVARATVAKAVAELASRGILRVERGRGAFVAVRPEGVPGRKEDAVRAIHGLLDRLESLRIPPAEARAMIDLCLREREERAAGIHIAVVDCNPESLGIYEAQMGLLSRLPVAKILLDDLRRRGDAEKRLEGFDLVLTTSTHHAEIVSLAPGLRDRIVEAAVAPAQETVVRLAAIRSGPAVGVLCRSAQFLAIVRNRLRELSIANPVEHLFFPVSADALQGFLAGREALIVPPGHRGALPSEAAPVLQRFTEAGGSLIVFDYRIERGSLVHLEERIRALRNP